MTCNILLKVGYVASVTRNFHKLGFNLRIYVNLARSQAVCYVYCSNKWQRLQSPLVFLILSSIFTLGFSKRCFSQQVCISQLF